MPASATSWVQHHLLQLHGPLVYIVVGVLVFIEVGIVIGFFIPGEIATVMGGVIASQHHVNVVLMVVVVAVAATVGNLSGYELGKVIGPWLMSHRPLRGSRDVAKAEKLVARRGGPAILLGRWIAVVRAVLPGLAGMSGMDLRIFMIFSAIGGAAWATMWVLVGYAAGSAYQTVLNAGQKWSLIALGVIVLALVARFVIRKRMDRRESGNATP